MDEIRREQLNQRTFHHVCPFILIGTTEVEADVDGSIVHSNNSPQLLPRVFPLDDEEADDPSANPAPRPLEH